MSELKKKAKTSQEIAFDWGSIIRKAKGATYDKQYKSYTQKRNKKWVRLEDVKQIIRNILDDFGDISDYDNDDVIELHKALTKLLKEEKP
jgi:hypothetical protein